MDLARPGGGDHVGDGIERHRRGAARIDDQVRMLVDRGAVGFPRAHQHVDLAIAEAVARGDFTAHFFTTTSAIWRVVRPSAAARSWSKRIWISGKPCSTVDFTSA